MLESSRFNTPGGGGAPPEYARIIARQRVPADIERSRFPGS